MFEKLVDEWKLLMNSVEKSVFLHSRLPSAATVLVMSIFSVCSMLHTKDY